MRRLTAEDARLIKQSGCTISTGRAVTDRPREERRQIRQRSGRLTAEMDEPSCEDATDREDADDRRVMDVLIKRMDGHQRYTEPFIRTPARMPIDRQSDDRLTRGWIDYVCRHDRETHRRSRAFTDFDRGMHAWTPRRRIDRDQGIFTD
jgi:hypothetical protein